MRFLPMTIGTAILCLFGLFVFTEGSFACPSDQFLVGVSKKDVTGPAAEIALHGYVQPLRQQASGLHTRLYARTFVIESLCNHNRVALVTVDATMITHAVKVAVANRINEYFSSGKFSAANILVSATHTHSAPGGYSHYVLYGLPIFGFSKPHFEVLVNGIVQSIISADRDKIPSQIEMGTGELDGASVNRSPLAYLKNPRRERKLYTSSTDHEMTSLKFVATDGRELGLQNWFAVHATSINNYNSLISSDNKGYASWVVEEKYAPNQPGFVAAFAQGNEGDSSPNVKTGGDPYENDVEGAMESGQKQAEKALEILNSTSSKLSGGVLYKHAYFKFDEQTINQEFSGSKDEASTCRAALGISMLAGAEDGRGVGSEGVACNEDLTNIFGKLICKVSFNACQGIKPIILETGAMKPRPWTPNILPLQLIKIGQLLVASVPFEMTTMAGRRLKSMLAKRMAGTGISRIVLAGLANSYSGYVTTREEYQLQQYEAASNHFGPWSSIFIQQTMAGLADALIGGYAVPTLNPPEWDCCKVNVPIIGNHDSFAKGVLPGDVLGSNIQSAIKPGDTVEVEFAAGHLRHGMGRIASFGIVEHLEAGTWQVIATDNDWSTRILYKRTRCGLSLNCSHVTVTWETPKIVVPGEYRIKHQGFFKAKGSDQPVYYSGISPVFEVSQ